MVQESESDRDYLVSIIIATFNAGAHLKACLLSIIPFSSENKIQVIVVDGGSKDQTVAILEENTFSGLQWISESDNGIYDALNKGIELARGRWLYFLGSDDLLLPEFRKVMDMLRSPDTVYYGIPKGYYLQDKKADFILLTGKFSGYRMAKYCLNHQVILYPASVFFKYRYQIKYKVLADYALNIQVWGDTTFKKKFIPLEFALYNMTGFSAFAKDELFEQEKPKIIRESLGLFVYWRWLLKVYKKKLRGETF